MKAVFEFSSVILVLSSQAAENRMPDEHSPVNTTLLTFQSKCKKNENRELNLQNTSGKFSKAF